MKKWLFLVVIIMIFGIIINYNKIFYTRNNLLKKVSNQKEVDTIKFTENLYEDDVGIGKIHYCSDNNNVYILQENLEDESKNIEIFKEYNTKQRQEVNHFLKEIIIYDDFDDKISVNESLINDLKNTKLKFEYKNKEKIDENECIKISLVEETKFMRIYYVDDVEYKIIRVENYIRENEGYEYITESVINLEYEVVKIKLYNENDYKDYKKIIHNG